MRVEARRLPRVLRRSRVRAMTPPMVPPVTKMGVLAPYASDTEQSRGRRYSEPESPIRTVFQRDRDRIIHSAAFRRLKHKTQVFVYHEGDYYRTRLTHSIEVAQIARTICRVLGLDEDLGEALALAHDLGHTPFGHAGEEALDEVMQPHGGFDHNAQTLRVLTVLEQRYIGFDGLNLTWETLEGIAKHNGPLVAKPGQPLPQFIVQYDSEHPLGLDTYPGAEAQVAALSDDIAYNNHDIDDGLRAGLFTVDDLRGVALAGPAFGEVLASHPEVDRSRLIHESSRRIIDNMVSDLVAQTRRRLEVERPASAEDVRQLDQPLVSFSDPMAEQDRHLKAFLFEHMYRHAKVMAMADRARVVVRELFEHYLDRPDHLPAEWHERFAGGEEGGPRLVADYIAGMTDRFALDAHEKLYK